MTKLSYPRYETAFQKAIERLGDKEQMVYKRNIKKKPKLCRNSNVILVFKGTTNVCKDIKELKRK